MDDPRQSAEAGGPVYGPPPRPPEPPADFLPLRLVLQGSEFGIDLTRPDVVIGRHTDADVRLPLPDVSRRHCRFVFADRHWLVYDLNSLNGVHVNGRRVAQAVLGHDDLVRIGSYTFVVDLHAGAQTELLSGGKLAQFLHRITDTLPRTVRDADGRRRAS